MELRHFGQRSGYQVAPVSIGAMRFPEDTIDAVEVVRHAIDSGMRHIDTSRGYGESEFVLSRALADGYRDKVILSSKCSPWIRKIQSSDDGSADSVRRRIDETLLRLGVEYLDFYQVWNITNAETWELATKPGGSVEGIQRAVDEGLVKHIGFTAHDSCDHLLEVVPTAEFQARRAVHMLERIATPAARRLLEVLAGGADAAHLTRLAKDALVRLGRLGGPAKQRDKSLERVGAVPLLRTVASRVDLAQPKVGYQQLLTAEDVQRQEAVVVVEAVEEPAFLPALDRIVGGIEVQHDLLPVPTGRDARR